MALSCTTNSVEQYNSCLECSKTCSQKADFTRVLAIAHRSMRFSAYQVEEIFDKSFQTVLEMREKREKGEREPWRWRRDLGNRFIHSWPLVSSSSSSSSSWNTGSSNLYRYRPSSSGASTTAAPHHAGSTARPAAYVVIWPLCAQAWYPPGAVTSWASESSRHRWFLIFCVYHRLDGPCACQYT